MPITYTYNFFNKDGELDFAKIEEAQPDEIEAWLKSRLSENYDPHNPFDPQLRACPQRIFCDNFASFSTKVQSALKKATLSLLSVDAVVHSQKNDMIPFNIMEFAVCAFQGDCIEKLQLISVLEAIVYEQEAHSAIRRFALQTLIGVRNAKSPHDWIEMLDDLSRRDVPVLGIVGFISGAILQSGFEPLLSWLQSRFNVGTFGEEWKQSIFPSISQNRYEFVRLGLSGEQLIQRINSLEGSLPSFVLEDLRQLFTEMGYIGKSSPRKATFPPARFSRN